MGKRGRLIGEQEGGGKGVQTTRERIHLPSPPLVIGKADRVHQ